jgi:glycerol-3-phosphate dehydrogenase
MMGQFDMPDWGCMIAQTADEAGACILNYTKVAGLIKMKQENYRLESSPRNR